MATKILTPFPLHISVSLDFFINKIWVFIPKSWLSSFFPIVLLLEQMDNRKSTNLVEIQSLIGFVAERTGKFKVYSKTKDFQELSGFLRQLS